MMFATSVRFECLCVCVYIYYRKRVKEKGQLKEKREIDREKMAPRE